MRKSFGLRHLHTPVGNTSAHSPLNLSLGYTRPLLSNVAALISRGYWGGIFITQPIICSIVIDSVRGEAPSAGCRDILPVRLFLAFFHKMLGSLVIPSVI